MNFGLEKKLRSRLFLFATVTLTGIALALFDAGWVSGPVTLTGFAGLFWAMHRLGRLGPDAEPWSRPLSDQDPEDTTD